MLPSLKRHLPGCLIAAALCLPTSAARTGALPYRFLLVISSQWRDPASYVIERGGEFQIVAALLRTWGLPFDVLRLDQQRIDKYHLLEREGGPRYGVIIWDAGASALEGKDAALIQSLVKDYGVGLVVLGDSVAPPGISDLAGVRWVSGFELPADLSVTREHFITRGMKDRGWEFGGRSGHLPGDKVEVQDATVLMSWAKLPFLTLRSFPGDGGRVVWLDAHRPSAQIRKQLVRDLLKRCLVWAQGYALYAEYPKSVLLEMHDLGAADGTFVPYWHYRTLSEAELRAGVIEPLKKRHAVLNVMVNTGWVDRKTQQILNPWEQRNVIDELDGNTVHDYGSTKRGLDAGVREGVFEMNSHGWTHMLPDLDSPPGPFWTAPLDGVGSLGWSVEFGDRLRNRDIPAATQRFHLERSKEYIRKDFGATPLFVRPGGGANSSSYANHTGRIAAQAGFGLTRFECPIYLGNDLVLALESVAPVGAYAFDTKLTAADVPWTFDAPYFLPFHDRDVAMDSRTLERLLNGLGDGVRFLAASEYVGYLHTEVEREAASDGSPALAVRYDPHYCRYFATHKSVWTLHLSDDMRQTLQTALPEKRTVELPAGLGPHRVQLGSAGVSAGAKSN